MADEIDNTDAPLDSLKVSEPDIEKLLDSLKTSEPDMEKLLAGLNAVRHHSRLRPGP